MPQKKSSATVQAGPLVNPLVTGIDHCSLIVADTQQALEFYTGILELDVDDSRPDLGYPGAWLVIGDKQIHLLELPDPYPVSGHPEHGGRDRHLALKVTDLNLIVERLEAGKIDFSKSKSGRAAIFCRDFDGNAIELVQSE